MRAAAKNLVKIALEALFPHRCCACNRFFRSAGGGSAAPKASGDGASDGFAAGMAEFVCRECALNFKPVPSPFCTLCGMPCESGHGADRVCSNCRTRPPDYLAARSMGLYEGPLRQAVRHLKYKGSDRLAEPLGRLLWDTLIGSWPPDTIDRIIPVPLHTRRLRQRGFNQAGLLVRKWPNMAGLVAEEALIRHADTPPQTGLDKSQRKANMSRAFSVGDPEAVRGRRLLLVDDVMTTGATVGACARSLMQAGALDVRVLTLARAI